MKNEKKAKQNYPHPMGFRFGESDRKFVERELKILKKSLNAGRDPTLKLILGNDIALEALKIGFAALRKQAAGKIKSES